MKVTDRSRTCPVIAVFLILAVLSPRYFAQEVKQPTASPMGIGGPPLSFAGCYELKLGRWWPWSFGEDTQFVTPPNQIQLLPEKGTDGFEKYGFVIREILPATRTTSARKSFSYWQVRSNDHIDLIWTNGFSGVTLKLGRRGKELHGWAHPHFDFPIFVPHIMRVIARQARCNPSQ
jgi:hypothetical protein